VRLRTRSSHNRKLPGGSPYFIGTGAHTREGSPAENAGRIKVPVLLFHDARDNAVRIVRSQMMDHALSAAGVKHELVILEGLDHSGTRTEVLRHSDAFLREAFSHSRNTPPALPGEGRRRRPLGREGRNLSQGLNRLRTCAQTPARGDRAARAGGQLLPIVDQHVVVLHAADMRPLLCKRQ
jgi:hypothetical protein